MIDSNIFLELLLSSLAVAGELINDFVRDDVERYHILWWVLIISLQVYASNEEIYCGLIGWPTKHKFREIA